MPKTYTYTSAIPGKTSKTIGPFKNVATARRFLAQALIDNGYANSGDAIAFANSITPGAPPKEHPDALRKYSIEEATHG